MLPRLVRRVWTVAAASGGRVGVRIVAWQQLGGNCRHHPMAKAALWE